VKERQTPFYSSVFMSFKSLPFFFSPRKIHAFIRRPLSISAVTSIKRKTTCQLLPLFHAFSHTYILYIH